MGKFSRLGNDLYEGRVSVDFVGRARTWYAMSAVIFVLALVGLFGRGLDLGIEFEGGVEYRVSVPADQVTDQNAELVRAAIADTGIPNAAAPVVNTSGTDTLRATVQPLSNNQSTQVTQAIQDSLGVPASAVSQQSIGATWGSQVLTRALTGLVVFIFAVVLFIWAYFREWKMSVAAIVALAHDLLITVGVYALVGFEVTPATITGVLTILGFSLYDTVVVFDKVRENVVLGKHRGWSYRHAANLAVNQTLVRSINTSVVALLPVGAILAVGVYTLGSGALKDLALALFVGMAAGAYSSIFIATPLLVQLKMREKDVQAGDRRMERRTARQADRYAEVPTYSETMESQDVDEHPAELNEYADPDALTPADTRQVHDEAMGSGRVQPRATRPVGESRSAKRSQPSRSTREDRRRGR